VTDTDPDSTKLPVSNTPEVSALAAFAQLMGLDANLLSEAYSTLQQAQEIASTHQSQGAESKALRVQTKKNYLDKELVYEDEGAFIYRRGDTKKLTWYLRIFNESTKKPFVKSLSTTDKTKAITTARVIYQEIKSKISRGERLDSGCSKELVEKYLSSLHVTTIPHAGVTPDTYKLKSYFLRVWLEFIDFLGHTTTPIDRLPEERLRDFANWFRTKPRVDGRTGDRSIEQINNAVSEVRLMYYKSAVRQKLIAKDKVPEIDRLKQPRETGQARDIMTIEQYEKYWKYLEYTYTREKGITPLEKQRRILFTKTVGILVNTGLRPKELLGLKWYEISNQVVGDEEIRKKGCVITVRADNSKTGRSRNVVSLVKRRFEVIKKSYKDIGVQVNANDFVFMNHTKENRIAYTRQMLYQRLQETIALSGIKEELDKINEHISLYSFRHQYIAWRLRYGGVPIHLIAKNCGTSIFQVERTYGHIETEKQIEIITKNQGISKKAEVELTTIVQGDTE
jgi:integrase